MSPSILNNSSLSDIHRLREDFVNQTTKHLSTPWEDQILQATKACEVWKSEADESNRKVCAYLFQKNLILSHFPKFYHLHSPSALLPSYYAVASL